MQKNMHASWSDQTIIVAPGGAKNALADDHLRRWPVENYARLISLLKERGAVVIVTGAETDAWVLPHFKGLAFENLIGRQGILELIETLKSADWLITHDSGPMHLAKLAGCRVIALFGPTNPHEKVSPREKIHVLWGGEDLPCRPCYNGKRYADCPYPTCLAQITPEQILRVIDENSLCL